MSNFKTGDRVAYDIVFWEDVMNPITTKIITRRGTIHLIHDGLATIIEDSKPPRKTADVYPVRNLRKLVKKERRRVCISEKDLEQFKRLPSALLEVSVTPFTTDDVEFVEVKRKR